MGHHGLHAVKGEAGLDLPPRPFFDEEAEAVKGLQDSDDEREQAQQEVQSNAYEPITPPIPEPKVTAAKMDVRRAKISLEDGWEFLPSDADPDVDSISSDEYNLKSRFWWQVRYLRRV